MATRRSSRSQPRIRNLRWDGALHSFAAFGAGTSAQVMVTAGSDTETLMRIRGELICYKDAASTPGLSAQIAIGAIVMPEGQSTTVVSSPITDDTAPWLFYETFVIGYEEMVTDVVDVPGLSSFRKTVDVKAQRILRPDREVQLVVENVTITGATTVNLMFAFRALLGQH